MAGLAAAERLGTAGRRVVVLEARDRLGGRIHTVTIPGSSTPWSSAPSSSTAGRPHCST